MSTDRPKYGPLRLLAAKIETTTGVPESVSGTDATMKVFSPVMTPDDNTNERELQAGSGMDKSQPGAKSGKLTFETEIISGQSQPAWATELLPMCDWEASGNTYTATNGQKTGTFVFYEDGLKRTLYGARGSFKVMLRTGQPGRVQWEFTGKYKDTLDAAILSPTFETGLAPIFQGGTNTVTIGSFRPNLSTLEIDSGNVVVLRESPNDPGGDDTGFYAAAIPNRKPIGRMDPEAVAVATRDVRGIRAASTEETLTVVLGTVAASNRVTISSSHFQTVKTPRGDRNGLLTDEIEFQMNTASPFSIQFNDA